ncbi:MAG: DUF1853 family protein [Sediminicola sp.]
MPSDDLSPYTAFLDTPPLWYGTWNGLRQFKLPPIALGTLLPLAPSHHKRLGHQMEEVFLRLMEHTGRYGPLLHSIPVRDHKRSLGEIDFLLFDIPLQKLQHIELTYKFYLLLPALTKTFPNLIGPNRNDSLSAKLEKIKTAQLPLLQRPEAHEILKERGMANVGLEQYVCFKAQLFLPYGTSNCSITPLNAECVAGKWIRFYDFGKQGDLGCHYHIPPKRLWPLKPRLNVAWEGYPTVLLHIGELMGHERSPLVWVKAPNGALSKLFVVWW